MTLRTGTMTVEVTYDDEITDMESIANAMDSMVETAMGILWQVNEYGEVKVGPFLTCIRAVNGGLDLRTTTESLGDRDKTLVRMLIRDEKGRVAIGFLSAATGKTGVIYSLTVKRTKDGVGHRGESQLTAIAHLSKLRHDNYDAALALDL